MIFRKPYAFLIKHFKLINGLLVLFLLLFAYRLNQLHIVIKSIFNNNVSNFSNLNDTYIGFIMTIIIFVLLVILSILIVLLKRKKKPINDYLYCVLYIFVIIFYLISVSNLFNTLENTLVEQSKLNLYKDISLYVYVPLIYFIIKFLLIFIGFNLNKFNFAQDIIDIKETSEDNEEVEIIFNKNSYKYLRKLRKVLRELKYYYFENRIIINIILSSCLVVIIISIFSMVTFFNKTYKLGSTFKSGMFSYKINSVYETTKDLNGNIIRSDSKYIVLNASIVNLSYLNASISLNDIRLLYGNEFAYATNYYNSNFIDLGIPYNKESLISKSKNDYLFIFKVPLSYSSNSYTLKIYDKIDYENKKQKSVYQVVKLKSTNLDNKKLIKQVDFSNKFILDSDYYGETSLLFSSYDFANSYDYSYKECVLQKCEEKTGILNIGGDTDKTLLILEYALSIDKDVPISKYFVDDKKFFSRFLKIKYTYKNKDKYYNNVEVINSGVDNKVFLLVPRYISKSSSISIVISTRYKNIIYKIF